MEAVSQKWEAVFLMPACQWFADKIAQAIQKSELFVQFFVDASSGL